MDLADDPELAAVMQPIVKHRSLTRLAVVGVAVAAIAGFHASGIGTRLSWVSLREHLDPIRSLVAPHPVAAAVAFVAIYAGATACSLPVATGLTLAAGAVFGRVVGTATVSVGSTLGATLAMLASRYVLADKVRTRFGERLKVIDEGVKRDGVFYLFMLRLVPAFPFVLINLAMGLTLMRVLPYALTSALGMLPATILYINAGAELATIERPGQILSPRIIASFVILGVAPLVFRRALERWKPATKSAESSPAKSA